VPTRTDTMSSEGPLWSMGSGSPWAGGYQSSELAGLSCAPLTRNKEVQLFPVRLSGCTSGQMSHPGDPQMQYPGEERMRGKYVLGVGEPWDLGRTGFT
jgi:hypothetical protein